MAIRFFSDDVAFILKKKRKIANWLQNVAFEEKKKIESINYVFVSDETILEMNYKFLKHKYCTDIITFDNSSSVIKLSGEMYISVDTVRENAEYYKVDFEKELLRVILHGLMHLCGYNDINDSEIEKMRQVENKYLNLYDANTTI